MWADRGLEEIWKNRPFFNETEDEAKKQIERNELKDEDKTKIFNNFKKQLNNGCQMYTCGQCANYGSKSEMWDAEVACKSGD